MTKKLIDVRNDVQLWHVTHPSGAAEAFVIEDPRRTPETWGKSDRAEALKIFEDRVEYAKTHPPLR